MSAAAARRVTAKTPAATWAPTPRETWLPLPAAWAAYEVRIDPEPYRMSAQQVAAWRSVWRMLFDRAAAQYAAQQKANG